MDKKVIPCSGFIILSNDKKRTVLVRTHRGNFSFPKGKRKKGETYKETALRELEEETGLREEDIVIQNISCFDELSYKGNPSVRYFVAIAKNEDFTISLTLMN